MTRKQAIEKVVGEWGETYGWIEEYFVYLDDLRYEGSINMMGAVPYLMEEKELSRDMAKAVLMAWMDSFDDEGEE